MNIIKMMDYNKWTKKIMGNWVVIIIATNMTFILLLLVLGKITPGQLIERTVSVFTLFILVFVVIFIPRRWLRNSRNYRYFLISLYKKYSEIFYLRTIIGSWSINISFIIFDYLGYYMRRIIYLLFIGTGQKEIWPYRKNRQLGMLILVIYLNFMGFLEYVYWNVVRIFYEIIYTYDTKPIKEIVKSRVMGYMMVMSLFYALGEHWFKIYIGVILVVIFVRHWINIIYFFRTTVKAAKEKNMVIDETQMLMDASMLYGYGIYLQYLLVNLDEILPKIPLLGAGIIFSIGKRLRWKYPQYLLPTTLTTSLKYNTRLGRYCIIKGGDKSWKHSDALYSKEDLENHDRRIRRNTSTIQLRYITKSMEKFFKKKRYMSFEIQYIDDMIGKELILEYFPTLQNMVNYADNLYAIKPLFQDIIDTKKPRYFLLTRKMELYHKYSLIQYIYSPDFQEEEDYNFYVVETMRDFWGEFIELKQFSSITRKFLRIVEKEGGRQAIKERIKKALGEDQDRWRQINLVPYIFKIIKEWEEKYNW